MHDQAKPGLIRMAIMLLAIAWFAIGCGGGGSDTLTPSAAGGPSKGLPPSVTPPGIPNPVVGPEAMIDITLDVVDNEGQPVNGFRWLVEEDTTFDVVPGLTVPDSMGVNISGSHAPTLSAGSVTGSSAVISVPDDKRLMVSVLPLEPGWQMSGANVDIGQTAVTVVVNKPPIPTAQISIYVFHDNKPLNNAPDIPTEGGLEGFSILLKDIAGQQMMDAFGNMIGTTYMMNGSTVMLDPDGNPMVMMMGTGVIKTDANGEALIKNLAPNKYGIEIIPPSGEGWIQTTTIEGSPTIDAWVRANEPRFLSEFGLYTWHTFFGFTKAMDFPPPAGTVGSITGQVTYLHMNRPPAPRGLNSGDIPPYAWVGLNDLDGDDSQVYAGPCNIDGTFTIENVPPGNYQLVAWDWALDVIIGFQTVFVPPEGGVVALGKVPQFAWFGQYEGKVFWDSDQDGYMDPDEDGLPGQAVILRFKDGSIYKAATTNPVGSFCIPEVFPFFYFLIAEVDFARYKATGATFIVDDGGEVAPGEVLNPQPQPDNGGLPYRTELGEVLTQAMLLYAGQTNKTYWGKASYGPGENGGISGLVVYATTRAVDNPKLAAAEPWEPGIPRVQVNLYQDADFDQVIDDLADGGTSVDLADVDNYPLGWAEGGVKGPEDLDRNLNGIFDPGDAIAITFTDSFDDNLPTGCVGPTYTLYGQTVPSCAEMYRTWNQMRPAVFDGGYAFNEYVPDGIASGNSVVAGIPAGYYIVEAATPPGYEIQTEESKNVDFGENFIPAAAPILGPPPCVGDGHTVAAELTLFPGVPAAWAGENRPLCDRKHVYLAETRNAAAEFFLYTVTPKSGRIWGWVPDDLKYEYQPGTPNEGTNFSVGWIPVAIRDFRGNEIVRVYTDEWGKYDALVPANYTNNLPIPSGMSASMLRACVNDPGPIPDGLGGWMDDPFHNPTYGPTCYTFDYYPGKTTRLDTPVIPVGAMSAARDQRLDCEFPDGTPVIVQTDGPGGGPVADPGQNIVLTSMGSVQVPNPDYDPTDPLSSPTVARDFGFGAAGGEITLNGVPMAIVSWSDASITATVPGGAATGQITVERSSGIQSVAGITLHVSPATVTRVTPLSDVQAVVDAAAPGDLILFEPGIYSASPIVWKPLKLQGYGPYSTIIKGTRDPISSTAWYDKLEALATAGDVEFLPGQLEQMLFQAEGEAGPQPPGFFVSFAQSVTVNPADPALIDGFGIEGTRTKPAVVVNAYAPYTRISNNRMRGNSGYYAGGIRVGTPSIGDPLGDGYLGSGNHDMYIHNNHILMNGAFFGGGGIALFNGSDNYMVSDNYICGNFTLLYGGGIEHFGLSDNCTIYNNKILFNEAFDEGGGIMIAGELVEAGADLDVLSPGSGSVTVEANLIQGNLSTDDGGGVRTLMTNGEDVRNNPTDPSMWYAINFFDNIIVNNVAADAGGGMSLDDSALVSIINNTVAHNDSTSTGIDATGTCTPGNPLGQFCPAAGSTTTIPMAGGIQARAHSTRLQAAFGLGYEQTFTDPALHDNIIWQNRTFYWDYGYNGTWGGLRPDIPGGEAAIYWDLAVTGTLTPQSLNPMYSVLTNPAGYDGTNTGGDPAFLNSYFNEFYGTSAGYSALGNLITVAFKPIVPTGDYHIGAGAADNQGGGVFLGTFPELADDYDGDARAATPDAGADEL